MLDSQRSEKIEMLNVHKYSILFISLLFIYDYYFMTTPIVISVVEPKFDLLGPYNTTQYIVEDVYDQLIDLKNFNFIINPQPCQNYSAGLLLLVIVSSNPNNTEKRMAIRNTWGKSVDSTKVVFLIGEAENVTISQMIQNESMIYNDIVQGSFKDAYRNMTYKHVMGLKWVSHHCSMAKYILKTDDDVVVNSHGLRQFLARELSPWGATNLISCQVLEHAKAQRSFRSKWRVSPKEYSSHYYPTYCAGWAVLYSQDVVPKLLKGAQSLPYFWIDDVQITGVVAQKIGVARTPLSTLILSRSRANRLVSAGPEHVGPFLFGPPDLNANSISKIWKAIPE